LNFQKQERHRKVYILIISKETLRQ